MRFSRSTQFLATVAAAVLFGFAVDVPALTFDQSGSDAGSGSASGSNSGGGRDVVVEPTGELQTPGRLRIFVAAASVYPDGISGLGCTPNDAEDLKNRFTTLGARESDVVFLSSRGATKLDDYPSKQNIERKFKRFVESLRAEDLAIVYLSGHGLQFEGSDEAFFAPEDVDITDLRGSSVSITAMMDALSKSDATFRWLIVDACRNDPKKTKGGSKSDASSESPFASREVGAKDLGEIANVPATVALLQSCQPGKRSYEGGFGKAESIKNGFFTLSLLEALDKERALADANGDGKITFSEMFDYVSRETDEKARRYYGCSQVPNLTGNITNFAIIADALKEGLKIADWNEADGLYNEACVLRRAKKYAEARRKIAEARKINKINESYQLEEETITQLADEESARLEAEAAKREAESARLEAESARREAEERARQAQTRPVSTPTREAESPKPSSSSTTQTASDYGWGDSTTRKAGTRKTLTADGIEYGFCWCPPGEFEMGSPKDEEGRYSGETRHTVKLPRGFWMLESEVTVGMWRSFVEDAGYQCGSGVDGWGYDASTGKYEQDAKYTWDNPGFPQTDAHPVTEIDYEGAKAFCAWFGKKTGMSCRLPTEAEWEYACRAGTKTAYFFGENPEELSDYANVADASAKKKFPGWTGIDSDDGKVFTAPVKSYKPNKWNLYDMHGNVYEWCSDWYGAYPSGVVEAPTGPTSASDRVIRGGSWDDRARGCRSARRSHGEPSGRYFNVGLRLVLSSSK